MMRTNHIKRLQSLTGVSLEQHYEVVRQLGEGSFAKVVEVVLKQQPKTRQAAKIIEGVNIENQDAVERQIQNFKRIKSDHVLKYQRTIRDDTNQTINIIMELCEMNLRTYFTKHKAIWNLRDFIDFTHQIITAFLDLGDILHLDLKPENILIAGRHYFKVCDFGCSQATQKSLIQLREQLIFGTNLYIAPQKIRAPKHEYHKSIFDVWSFGIILYEILYKKHPFMNQKMSNVEGLKSRIVQYYDGKSDLQFPQRNILQTKMSILIKQMLTKKHQRRINWDQMHWQLIVNPAFGGTSAYFLKLQDLLGKYVDTIYMFSLMICHIKENIETNPHIFYKNNQKFLSEFLIRLTQLQGKHCAYFQSTFLPLLKLIIQKRQFNQLVFIRKNIDQELRNVQKTSKSELLDICQTFKGLEHIIVENCMQVQLATQKYQVKWTSMQQISTMCKQIILAFKKRGTLFCQGELMKQTISVFHVMSHEERKQLNILND